MTANEITSHLLIAIPERFHARAWRANTGAAVGPNGRMIRFGLPGFADISGILVVAEFGVRMEIEVKAGRDRLRPAQESFGQMIRSMGGIWLVARDVEPALSELAYWRDRLGGKQQ